MIDQIYIIYLEKSISFLAIESFTELCVLKFIIRKFRMRLSTFLQCIKKKFIYAATIFFVTKFLNAAYESIEIVM